MKLVLATGIEGFVGRHLTDELVASGYEVAGIHLAPAPSGLPARLFQGSVCDYAWLRNTLGEVKPDAVIHLAAISSVADSESKALGMFDVNAVGTLKLFEALNGLVLRPRVLLVSSGNVYGRVEAGTPLSEDYPAAPIDAYGMSKLAAEQVGRFYHRAYGADVVILRPFSHTGPGQNVGFVFPSVARRIVEIERAAERDPKTTQTARTIELGNLDVRRDYSDVRDIARAYALAIDKAEPGQTYNITSGHTVSIREGVETLRGLARTEVKYVSIAARRRERDLPLLTGDSTRFRALTGWEPRIPFDKTLSDLLDYHRGLSV